MSYWNGRRVLITGGTGFLGSALADELLSRGAEITVLVRDTVPRAPFFRRGTLERVSVVHGSIGDLDVLERALAEYEVEVVFHLAAQSIRTVANRNPVATFETNIRGTWCLLEACRRSGGVSRIVVASSDKAYGTQGEQPFTEDCPLQGNLPYDVSKSCADLIASTYHHTYGTPVCITRSGNLFGPGDLNFSRLIPGTIRSVLDGKRPVIRSDGTPKRDYVYVDDIANAYLLLAERMEDPEVMGRAFNFGTGAPHSVLELTQTILRVSGREDLEPVVTNEAKSELGDQYLSSELSKRLLGWSPGASLEDRLARTVRWYGRYLKSKDGTVEE